MTSTTGPRPNARLIGATAFTLIELILVMALLVVVIALISPQLSDFFRGRNLDSESTRFLALTRYARSRAVSEGVPMLLWLDPSQRAYGLTEEYSFSQQQDDKAVTYQLDPDIELVLDAQGMPANRAAQTLPGTLSLGADAVAIRFQPDGFVGEASPQSIYFRERERDGQTGQRPAGLHSVWVTKSENRASYEIQTNNVAFVRR
jgi:Tfp pilus assembly protein FimT